MLVVCIRILTLLNYGKAIRYRVAIKANNWLIVLWLIIKNLGYFFWGIKIYLFDLYVTWRIVKVIVLSNL